MVGAFIVKITAETPEMRAGRERQRLGGDLRSTGSDNT